VIGQAQTGSGKTAAFGLPMLQYVDPSEHEVQGLVLTPTRELCIQVTQALRAYGSRKGVDVVAVFGGAPIRTQQAQLRAGGHVVVGTVGRVKDLISRHSLMLHSTRFVVLDEADEMLDLGFLEDVERILSLTPSSRQTALFSATMPPEIRRLADQYLYNPITIKVKNATLTVDTVEQFALEVPAREKPDALARVLEAEKPDQALVFVRTKIRCDQLYRSLRDKGWNVKAIHGDMTQGARDGVMISFKDGRLPLLIATDVASRGLDHLLRAPTAARDRRHRAARGGEALALGQGCPRRAHAGQAAAAPSLQAARPGQRGQPIAQAHRLRWAGGGPRALGHHPCHHLGHGARRRSGPQHPRARALRLRRGSRAGCRSRGREGQRHRSSRPAAATRAGADLRTASSVASLSCQQQT
jgi:hypothetical protein